MAFERHGPIRVGHLVPAIVLSLCIGCGTAYEGSLNMAVSHSIASGGLISLAAVNASPAKEQEVFVSVPPANASIAALGPFPFSYEGSQVTRRPRRCLLESNSGPNSDWPAASEAKSMQAWPHGEQPPPFSCWPLVATGAQWTHGPFDASRNEYIGSCGATSENAIKVLASLTQFVVTSLPLAFASTKQLQAKADARRCRDACYENIYCEYWQFRQGSGCYAQNALGEVPYPLVEADVQAVSHGETVSGEYLLHYCNPAIPSLTLSPSGDSLSASTKLRLVEWKFVQGDRIPAGETVAVLQSVDTEDIVNVTSPVNGALLSIEVLPNEVVKGESVLGRLTPILEMKSLTAPTGTWRVELVNVKYKDFVKDGVLIAQLRDVELGAVFRSHSLDPGYITKLEVQEGTTVQGGSEVAEMAISPDLHAKEATLSDMSFTGVTLLGDLDPSFSSSAKDYSVAVPMDTPFTIAVTAREPDGYVGIESDDVDLPEDTPGCVKTAAKHQADLLVPGLPLRIEAYKMAVCVGYMKLGQLSDVVRYSLTVTSRGTGPMLRMIDIEGGVMVPAYAPDVFEYKVIVPLSHRSVKLLPQPYKGLETQVQVTVEASTSRNDPSGATIVDMPNNMNKDPENAAQFVWDVPVTIDLLQDGETSQYQVVLSENVSRYTYLDSLTVLKLDHSKDPVVTTECGIYPSFSPEQAKYQCGAAQYWYTDGEMVSLIPTIEKAQCIDCTIRAPPLIPDEHGLDVQVVRMDLEEWQFGKPWNISLTYGEKQIIQFLVTAQDMLTTTNYIVVVERGAPFYLNAQFSQYFSRAVTYSAWGIVLLGHGGGGSQTIKAIDFMNGICSIKYTTELVSNFGGELGAFNNIIEEHVMDLVSGVISFLPIHIQGSFLDPLFWKKLKKQIMTNIKKEFSKGKKKHGGDILETWFHYCRLRYSQGKEYAVEEVLQTPKGQDMLEARKEMGEESDDPDEPVDCGVNFRKIIDCDEFPVCPEEGDEQPEVFWALFEDFEKAYALSKDMGEGLLSFLMNAAESLMLLVGWWLLRCTAERYTAPEIGLGSAIAFACLALVCGVVWGTLGKVPAVLVAFLGFWILVSVTACCCCCARRRKGSTGVPNHLQALEPYRIWFFAMDLFIIANARRACLVVRTLPNFSVPELQNNQFLYWMCQLLIVYLFVHVIAGCFIAHVLTSRKEVAQSVPGFGYLRDLALNSDAQQGDPVRGYKSSPEYHKKGSDREEDPDDRKQVMQYNAAMDQWQDTNISHLSFGFVGRNLGHFIFFCTALIPAPFGPMMRSMARSVVSGLWLLRRVARECIPVRPLGGEQLFNPMVDDRATYHAGDRVDVYVFLSLQGWQRGRVKEVNEVGDIVVRYGDNEEQEKTLYGVSCFSVLYPRDSILQKSVEYAVGDPAQVHVSKPIWKLNKWHKGEVTRVDEESGEVEVTVPGTKDSPPVPHVVPASRRPVALKWGPPKEVAYETPEQWVKYKLEKQWTEACDEYQAKLGGFHLDGRNVTVDKSRRVLTHTGDSQPREMTLIDPALDATVEKADLSILVRSETIDDLELGVAADGKPVCGFQCRDGSKVNGDGRTSMNQDTQGRRYQKESVITLTFEKGENSSSLDVKDSHDLSFRLTPSLPKADKLQFYLTSGTRGNEVSILSCHLAKRRTLDQERTDNVALSRAKLYLLQHIEDMLKKEMFLRNFSVIWYEVQNRRHYPEKLQGRAKVSDEQDMIEECREFVPKLEIIKEGVSLADCVSFAERMSGIARIVPMVVQRATIREEGTESQDTLGPTPQQTKAKLAKQGTRSLQQAAKGGGQPGMPRLMTPTSSQGVGSPGPTGSHQMGATPSAGMKSTTSAYGFKREVAKPGSMIGMTLTSELDGELCYKVEPKLTSAHTSAKCVISLESNLIEDMYVGITAERQVPSGAGASLGGASAAVLRLSDCNALEPGSDWGPVGNLDVMTRQLRAGDQITLTYIVGDSRARGGELRVEDSRGFSARVTRSLPVLEKKEHMAFHFFVGTKGPGRSFRIVKVDVMEPSAMWQKCMSWATEAIAKPQAREMKEAPQYTPNYVMGILTKSELRLKAFLRRKGLKYMFAEALTFRHGAAMREEDDQMAGVPENMDTGAQLRYRMKPWSKMAGRVYAEWVKVDEEKDDDLKPLTKWQWLCYEHWDRPWWRQKVLDENGQPRDPPLRHKLWQKVVTTMPKNILNVYLKYYEGAVPLHIDEYEQAQMSEWVWQRLLQDCWIPKLQLGFLVESLRETYEHLGEGDDDEALDASTEGLGQVLFEAHRFYCQVQGVRAPSTTAWMDNIRFVHRVVAQLQEMVDWGSLSFWSGSDTPNGAQVVVELDHERFRAEDRRRSITFYQDPDSKARFTPGEIYDYTDILADSDSPAMGDLAPVGVKNFDFCCPDGSWIQAGTKVELQHIPMLMRYVDGFRMCAPKVNLNSPWSDMFSVMFGGRSEKDEFDWFIYTSCLLLCTVLVETMPMGRGEEDALQEGNRRLAVVEKPQESIPLHLYLILLVVMFESWVMIRRVRSGESPFAAVPPICQLIAVLGLMNPWRELPPAPLSSWLAIIFFLLSMFMAVVRTMTHSEGGGKTNDLYQDMERMRMEYKISETGGLNMFAKGRQGEIALARNIRLRVARLGLVMSGQVRAPTILESSDRERNHKWPLKKLRYYEVPKGSRYRGAERHPRLRLGGGDVTNSFPVNLDVDQLTGAKSTPQIFASIQCLSPLSEASSLKALLGGGRLRPEHDPVLTLFLPEQEAEREPIEMMDTWQRQIEDWFQQELGAVREGTLTSEIQEHLRRTLTEEALDPSSLRRFSIKVSMTVRGPQDALRSWEGRHAYISVLFDSEQMAVDFPEGRSSVLGRLDNAGDESTGVEHASSSLGDLWGSSKLEEVVLDLPPFEVIPPASGRMRLVLWAQVPDSNEDEMLGFTDLLDFTKLTSLPHGVFKTLHSSWRLEGGGLSSLQVVPTSVDIERAQVSYWQSLRFSDRNVTYAKESPYPVVFHRFVTSLAIQNYYDVQQVKEELLTAPNDASQWTLQHERWNVWYLLFLAHLHVLVLLIWITLLRPVPPAVMGAWLATVVLSLPIAHFSWFHVVRRDCCHGKASAAFWFVWHCVPMVLGFYTAAEEWHVIHVRKHHHQSQVALTYLAISLALPMLANVFMSRAAQNAPQEMGGGFDLSRWIIPRRWRFKTSKLGQINLYVHEVSVRSDGEEWGYFTEQVNKVRNKLKAVTLTDDAVRRAPFNDNIFKMDAVRVYGVSQDTSRALYDFLKKQDLTKEVYGGPKFRDTMQKVKDHLAKLRPQDYRPGPPEIKSISKYVVWQDAMSSRTLSRNMLNFVEDSKHLALWMQTLVIFAFLGYQASIEDYYDEFEESDAGIATPINCFVTAGALFIQHVTFFPWLGLGWTYAGHPAVQNPKRSRTFWFGMLMHFLILLLLTIFAFSFMATWLAAVLGPFRYLLILGNLCWAAVTCLRLGRLLLEVCAPSLKERLMGKDGSHGKHGYTALTSDGNGEDLELENELLNRMRSHEGILRDQNRHVLHYVIVGEHLKPPTRALDKIGQPANDRCPDPIVPHAARLGARHIMVSLDPRDFTISWATPAETLAYLRRTVYSLFNLSYSMAWSFITKDKYVGQAYLREMLEEALTEDAAGKELLEDDKFLPAVLKGLAPTPGGPVNFNDISKLFSATERGRILDAPGFKNDVTGVFTENHVRLKGFEISGLADWLANHPKFARLEEFWALVSSGLTVEVDEFLQSMAAVPGFHHAVEGRLHHLAEDIQKDISALTGVSSTQLTQEMLKPVCGSEYSDAGLEDYVIPLGYIQSVKAGSHRLRGGPDDRLRSIEVTVSSEGSKSKEWQRFKNACSLQEQERCFATSNGFDGEVESVEVHMMDIHFSIWQRVIHDCCLDPHEVANDVMDTGSKGAPSGLPKQPTPEELWENLSQLRYDQPQWDSYLQPGMFCGRKLRPGDRIQARSDFSDFYSAEDIGIVQSVYQTRHGAERFNIIWLRTWKVSSMSTARDQWTRHFKFLSSFRLPAKPGPTLRVLKVKAAGVAEQSQSIEDNYGVIHQEGTEDVFDTEEARLHAALVNDNIPLSRVFGGWETGVQQKTIARQGSMMESMESDEVRMGTIIGIREGIAVQVRSADGEDVLSTDVYPKQAVVFGLNTEGAESVMVEATWLLDRGAKDGLIAFDEAWRSRFQIPLSDYSACFEIIHKVDEEIVLLEGDRLEAYWEADKAEHSSLEHGRISRFNNSASTFDVRWDRTGETTSVNGHYWTVRYRNYHAAKLQLQYRLVEPKHVQVKDGGWTVTCGTFTTLQPYFPKANRDGLHFFSVDPPLPNGMKLSAKTGSIIGSPMEEVQRQTYTVTMQITGTQRSCKTDIILTVRHAVPPPPPSLLMEVNRGTDLKTRGPYMQAGASMYNRPSYHSSDVADGGGCCAPLRARPKEHQIIQAGSTMPSGTNGAGSSNGPRRGGSAGSTSRWKVATEPAEPEFRFSLMDHGEKTTLLIAESREIVTSVDWYKRDLIGVPHEDAVWVFDCMESDYSSGHILLGSAEPMLTRDFLPAADAEDLERDINFLYDDMPVGIASIKVGWARQLSILVVKPLGLTPRPTLMCELRITRSNGGPEVFRERKPLGHNDSPMFLNGDVALFRSDILTFRIIEVTGTVTSNVFNSANDCEFFGSHASGRPFDLAADVEDQKTGLKIQVWNGKAEVDGVKLWQVE